MTQLLGNTTKDSRQCVTTDKQTIEQCRHSHDTAGSSATGVTSLERVGVAALAEIVSTGVDDNGSANDGLGAKERNVLVCPACISLCTLTGARNVS